ncbi:helix-loop-helix DNA-binding domain-containing protein [Phthorimaea operculella]|nr:helix-loop-helix DNA-binding domain-containing protein [Phthorimaea operculella]
METRNYWEENGHPVKYDNYNSNDDFGTAGASGELNFAAPHSDDEGEFPSGSYLKKGKQDPMSHRIIEKRRRDRMNNCLADLSRLIPPEYLKKGRGRVEKTEIIEMAIRHIKFLQERVNAAERQGEEFRAGFQEASSEAVRYLADVHGIQHNDGLCVQLAAHLHRHCDHIIKGEAVIVRHNPPRSHAGSSSLSSDQTSSSSSQLCYKPGVIATALPPAPPLYADNYEPERRPEQPNYQPMDCDRVPMNQMSIATESETVDAEPLPLLDGRRKREPTLRTVRKPEHNEDLLHSYKFKNSIERRFSRSQDCEAAEVARKANAHTHGKVFSHKRRRAAKPPNSTSTSNSGSTEEARDTSPQDTSSESPAPHHHHYEKPASSEFVPVFALNALGKYYVPLSVEYSCLARYLGSFDALDSRAAHMTTSLHPVTIHVNFQPCLTYHVKREPSERDWRPV